MATTSSILTLLLALALLASAALKLSRKPEVIASYARVGVPADKLPVLAFVLLAGAAGLLVGLAWSPLGVLTAGALVVYFGAAIVFHVRAKDLAHVGPPVVLALLATAALVLGLVEP